MSRLRVLSGREVCALLRESGASEPALQEGASRPARHRRRERKALTRTRALAAAAAGAHRRATKRLLVLDRGAMPRAALPGVELQPAYEWLLASPEEG